MHAVYVRAGLIQIKTVPTSLTLCNPTILNELIKILINIYFFHTFNSFGKATTVFYKTFKQESLQFKEDEGS